MPCTERLFEFERIGTSLCVRPMENLSEFATAAIHDEVAVLLEQLDAGDVREIVIDFIRTTYFGSSAIEALIRIGREMQKRNGVLVLCNLSNTEREILQVAQIQGLWTIRTNSKNSSSAIPPR